MIVVLRNDEGSSAVWSGRSMSWWTRPHRTPRIRYMGRLGSGSPLPLFYLNMRSSTFRFCLSRVHGKGHGEGGEGIEHDGLRLVTKSERRGREAEELTFVRAATQRPLPELVLGNLLSPPKTS